MESALHFDNTLQMGDKIIQLSEAIYWKPTSHVYMFLPNNWLD